MFFNQLGGALEWNRTRQTSLARHSPHWFDITGKLVSVLTPDFSQIIDLKVYESRNLLTKGAENEHKTILGKNISERFI